jgi:FkbM family methyltransferase
VNRYSQFAEQDAILAAVGGGEPLNFLDIGCWDPITFSNTRALFELGWSGVMIEPSPGPFVELLRTCTVCTTGCDEREHEPYGERKQRQCKVCGGVRYGFQTRVKLLLAAVGVNPGMVSMSATDDALSTSDKKSRVTWDKDGGFYGDFLVPVITLEQIANQFGGFQFVNLDVEGQSTDLLLEMLRLGWQTKCICVETDGRDQEIISAATPLHYHVTYGNGTNLVLVRQ